MCHMVEKLVSTWGCSTSLKVRNSFCAVQLLYSFEWTCAPACPLALQGKKMMPEMTVPCAPASQAFCEMWIRGTWFSSSGETHCFPKVSTMRPS